MIRIDYLIFGYRIFTVRKEHISKAADIFLANNVSVRFRGNTFLVSERKQKEIERLLGTRVEFSKSECCGFFGFLRKNRHRAGVLLVMLAILFALIFSENIVWDIRISGNEAYSEGEIIEELSLAGLEAGDLWSGKNLSRIEADMLSLSHTVSWISINRRGGVAYVNVIDRIDHGEEEKKEGYSNIVASASAVIEEITVIHGVAKVKAGDSVKKGDLLISGVLPEESGGGFCYAEGIVLGRVSDSIDVSVPLEQEVKVSENRRLVSLDIKIFGFSLNILNRGRNSEELCDIIKSNRSAHLLGKRLPISVLREYESVSETELKTLPADEVVAIARRQMAELLSEKLEGATLIRLKTDGEFTDSCYKISTSFVSVEEIGADLPFGVVP
jgi:similar to stage IV sporulation protein